MATAMQRAHEVFERIKKEGFDPKEYREMLQARENSVKQKDISFYNDRLSEITFANYMTEEEVEDTDLYQAMGVVVLERKKYVITANLYIPERPVERFIHTTDYQTPEEIDAIMTMLQRATDLQFKTDARTGGYVVFNTHMIKNVLFTVESVEE